MSEAVNIASTITKPHDVSFPELLEPQNLDSRAFVEEVKDLEASFKRALNHMTDEQIVSEAMAGYPKAPFSDLVSETIPLSCLYILSSLHFIVVYGETVKGRALYDSISNCCRYLYRGDYL